MTVYLDGSSNSGDEAVGDRFKNINGVWGSTHDDTLNGNVNANWILGDAGNDTVNAGAGNDTVYGGDGDGQLIGGDGADHTVKGGLGNDTLYGSDGNDSLNGEGNDDLLIGGSGNDILAGGAGRDTFLFDGPLGSVDSITDFSAADDTLQLDRSIFSGFGANVRLAFGQMANGGGAWIICNNGELSYDADGIGGAAAIKFATLSSTAGLSTADFLLI